MPRTYKRVGLVPPPSNEDLKKALDEILSGKCSITQTAKNHGLSKTTLARYAKLHKGCGLLSPLQVKSPQFHLQILSSEMERELSEYLLTCSLFNHGLTTIDTQKIAFSYAVANSLKTPANWHINGMASKDWLYGFMKRNQNLSVRKPESTSQARACGFNKPVVSAFYDKLFNVQAHYQFSADRVFNGDETSDTTVMPSPNVIAKKGAKQVQQTVSAERGENVTMLAFISADGKSIPPVFIFPRKKLKPEMYDGGPVGCLGLCHQSGWMTGENFFKSLQHFKMHVNCSKEKPVLLTMDNHTSHLDYRAVQFAKENGIVLLTFPPHCSHALQPLDVCVFGPFKSYLSKSHNEWLRLNPGKRITIKEVAKLSKQPFNESMTPKNIISAFECTGIFPFDRNKISEDRYAPSTVTDRPAPISIDIVSIDPAIKPPVGQQVSHSESESYPEVDLCQATEELFPLNIAEDQIAEDHITEEETTLQHFVPTKTHVTPADIRPYPRVSQDATSRKNKRSGRSRVLTDTPEKEQIEAEHNKKIEKESHRLKRCLLKESQVNNKKNASQIKPAATEKRPHKRKEPQQDNTSNKENVTHVNNNCDESPVACKTRSGRVSRRKIINDV